MSDNSKHDAKRSNLHTSTTQLGGRGTVRRRRYRRNANLSENQLSESMRHFLVRHEFQDYGQMERVSFVYENGDIASHDSVRLLANLKNGFYNFNLNTQTNPKRSKSRSSISSKSQTRTDKAGDLFHTLDFIKQQTQIGNLDSETQERIKFVTDEIHQLIGSDAYEFLSTFSQKSPVVEKDLSNFSTIIDDSEFIPEILTDFDKTSEEKSENIDNQLTVSSSTSLDPVSFSKEPEILVEKKTKVNMKPKKKKKKGKVKEQQAQKIESEFSSNKKSKESDKEKSKFLSNLELEKEKSKVEVSQASSEEIKSLVETDISKLDKKEKPKPVNDVKELRNMAFLRTTVPKKKKKSKNLSKKRKNEKIKECETDSNSKTDSNDKKTSMPIEKKKVDTTNKMTNSEHILGNNLNPKPVSNLSTDESSKSVDKKIRKRQNLDSNKTSKPQLVNRNDSEYNQNKEANDKKRKKSNKKKKSTKINSDLERTLNKQSIHSAKQEPDDADNIKKNPLLDIKLEQENLQNNSIDDNKKQNFQINQNEIFKSVNDVYKTLDSTNRCNIIMENLDRTKLEIEELTQGVISRQSVSSVETPCSMVNQSFSDSIRFEDIKDSKLNEQSQSDEIIEVLIEKALENTQKVRLERYDDDQKQNIGETSAISFVDDQESYGAEENKEKPGESLFSTLKINCETSAENQKEKQSNKNAKEKFRQPIQIINYNDEASNQKFPVHEILIEENLKIKAEMFYEKRVFIHKKFESSSQAKSFSKSKIVDIYNYNETNNENIIYEDIHRSKSITNINESSSATSRFYFNCFSSVNAKVRKRLSLGFYCFRDFY